MLRSFQGILYREGKELKKRCSEFWLSGSLIEVSFEVTSQGGVLQYAIKRQRARNCIYRYQSPQYMVTSLGRIKIGREYCV